MDRAGLGLNGWARQAVSRASASPCRVPSPASAGPGGVPRAESASGSPELWGLVSQFLL